MTMMDISSNMRKATKVTDTMAITSLNPVMYSCYSPVVVCSRVLSVSFSESCGVDSVEGGCFFSSSPRSRGWSRVGEVVVVCAPILICE
jgi:hypothetical protein